MECFICGFNGADPSIIANNGERDKRRIQHFICHKNLFVDFKEFL
jgi:hypothetical protein